MNKYIYRGFACLILIVVFDAFFVNSTLWVTIVFPFALLTYLLPPSTSPSYVLSCIVFVALFICGPVYAFLYSWLHAEIPDPNAPDKSNLGIFDKKVSIFDNLVNQLSQKKEVLPDHEYNLRKKINWCLIVISLLPLLFAGIAANNEHARALNAIDEKEELKKVKIENYRETPVQLWGSQLPIGLKVDFDLVGGNQENKVVYMNARINLDNGKIGIHCHSNSAELEAKKAIAGRYYVGDQGNAFLLRNIDRNQVSFTCHTNNFSYKVSNNNLCVKPIGALEMDWLQEGVALKKVSKNIKFLFSNLVPQIDFLGVEADSPVIDNIPENVLLFDPAFWIKNMTDYVNIPSADSGYAHCPELEKEYREGTKVTCFCKSTP